MPWVTIKTGLPEEDGTEAVLREYLCDWPDCGNIGEEVIGVLVEIRQLCIVCRKHAAQIHGRSQRDAA